MKSIIQKDRECLICGSYNVEEHHCFGGNPNRRLSEQFGLKVWLCPTHHRGTYGAHGREGAKLQKELHQLGQKAFEWTHTRDEFIATFGKSYLE